MIKKILAFFKKVFKINTSVSIPKKIHYIWLSGEEIPASLQKIMQTWKEKLPKYELVLWDKEAYEAISNKPQYVIDAYNQKKWAFVSDYIRAYALYTQGGWYFDTDLQIVRNELDNLSKHSVVSAIEITGNSYQYNTNTANNVQIQAAFIGGVKNHAFFNNILNYYNTAKFTYNSNNTLIAPVIYAKLAEKYGFKYLPISQQLYNDIYLVNYTEVLPHLVHYTKGMTPFAVHQCYHSWFDEPWGVPAENINFVNTLK